MTFELPDLPFAKDALQGAISAETLTFHHDKHHAKYVNTLNELVEGTEHADKTLEQLILEPPSTAIFNNAAQSWNHTFYWNSLSPKGGGKPSGKIAEEIQKSFGDFESFQKEFTQAASKHFGSGWAWLVRTSDGKLQVKQTHDAGNPITDGDHPLLTCDVWEHAYYIDYRNARPDYVAAWWKVVHWDFANERLRQGS